MLEPLIDDHDVGVRKFSIQAISPASSDTLKQKLRALATGDHPLRSIAELQARKLL